MSETRTVSPTLEERLAAVIATVVTNLYAPDSWADWPEDERRLDAKTYAVPHFLAAAKEHGLVIGEGELDAAWKEAEAALPEGGRLHIQRRAEAEEIEVKGGKKWIARQGRAAGAYEAWATTPTTALGFSYAATPTAALQALAAKLRDSRR